MRLLGNSLLFVICALVSGNLYASSTTIVESHDGIYDPSASWQKNCDELILGFEPHIFKAIEADGTIEIQLNIEENHAGNPSVHVYAKEKAFREYFTRKIMPYNPPRMVKQFLGDSVLPKLYTPARGWVLWNRTGYVRRLVNVTNGPTGFVAKELLQLSMTDDSPDSNEIIDLRSSELLIAQGKAYLTVRKMFKNSNRHVPGWLKSAEWVESRDCVFDLIN